MRHLGGNRVVPEVWYDRFYFTAPPLSVTPDLPLKDDLLDAVGKTFEQLETMIVSKPGSFWEEECHSDFLRADLPTEKDWYVHILTTHVAMHAGNIAAWRRVQSMGPAPYGDPGTT